MTHLLESGIMVELIEMINERMRDAMIGPLSGIRNLTKKRISRYLNESPSSGGTYRMDSRSNFKRPRTGTFAIDPIGNESGFILLFKYTPDQKYLKLNQKEWMYQ